MPPKGKKSKGKTLDINDFNKDVVDDAVVDWAAEDWTESEWNQNGGRREGQRSGIAEQIVKSYREFSRTANNALGGAESFRTAERAQPEALLNELKPPYVAHFGNIRNGTTEEAFLKLFDENVVLQHHLISQAGKSFAFVEFTTAEALRFALMLHNTYQRGRLLYVDLATPQQIDRLMNRNGGDKKGGGGAGEGFSRDSAGQRQTNRPSNLDFSRDVFGAQQPQETREFGSPLSGAGASRSNFGSKVDLHGVDELSRDLLGSAVQPAQPSKPMMNSSSPASPVQLANWRNEAQAVQANFADFRRGDTANEGEGPQSPSSPPSQQQQQQQPSSMQHEYSPRGRGGRRSNEPRSANSPHVASNATASFANWRDEPRAEQVRREEVADKEQTTTTAGGNNNTNSSGNMRGGHRGRGRGGGSRGEGSGGANFRNAERPSSPKATQPPQQQGGGANAEGGSAPKDAPPTADRWADLRR